jgi:VCBS repeat-containing protein
MVLLLGVENLTMAAGKQDSDELSSTTSFSGVPLLVTTNAQGELKSVSIQTTSSRYALLTNGMDIITLRNLIKMNDRPVELKGEISQVGNALCLKVIGPIKDLTPSLSGMSLSATVDSKSGEVTQITVRSADGKYSYKLVVDKSKSDALKILAKLNGKLVDVEGEISQSKMSITVTGAVRESRASALKKPPSSKKKSK